MRRAVAAALAAAALLSACGDDGKPAREATRPATTATAPPVPPFTRLEAVREMQSVASQEVSRRDFSYPAGAIAATCAPRPPLDGRARFACRFRSPKGACTGSAEIVRLPDGSNQSRAVKIECTGPPNI